MIESSISYNWGYFHLKFYILQLIKSVWLFVPWLSRFYMLYIHTFSSHGFKFLKNNWNFTFTSITLYNMTSLEFFIFIWNFSSNWGLMLSIVRKCENCTITWSLEPTTMHLGVSRLHTTTRCYHPWNIIYRSSTNLSLNIKGEKKKANKVSFTLAWHDSIHKMKVNFFWNFFSFFWIFKILV